jgi:hypothetical protein
MVENGIGVKLIAGIEPPSRLNSLIGPKLFTTEE